MANDVLRFVDSIASSPTTRLDINDGTTWTLDAAVFAPPPQMLRSVSSNAMTNGGYPSASRYDYRTIELSLLLNAATQDAAGTALQNLARELDRDGNFLKWQPDGATSPVFFKTWRTSPVSVVDVPAARAVYEVTLSIPADSMALGLRETISVGTVNNDPAAGSNGCYFDVTGVIGDVAAPMVLVDTGTLTSDAIIAIRQHGTVTDLPVAIQAESMTMGTDTSNPGGGPDAAMSGSGTNNYVRTTYASGATNAERVVYTTTTTATINALRGSFRAVAVLRRTSAVDNIYVSLETDGSYGIHVSNLAVLLPATTSRIQVDLGPVSFGSLDSPASPYVKVYFTSAGGAVADLDWDYVMFLPSDETTAILTVAAITDDLVIDGEIERTYLVANGANLYSSGTRETYAPALITGGFPQLIPNRTNRVFYVKHTAGVISKSTTGTVTVYYMPRYLHVRPATT